MPKPIKSIFIPSLAGFCALTVALGLGRFSYTPLLPALVHAHWLSAATASFVGTMNFIGYLVGAIFARLLTRFKSEQFWIKSNLCICTLSLVACIWRVNLSWLMFWRFWAGVSGAILVVLTPAVIYAAIDKDSRPLVAGIIFGGIGVGIVYSGIVVPMFVIKSIGSAWLAIAIAAILLTTVSFIFLPHKNISNELGSTKEKSVSNKLHWSGCIILLAVAYALFGVGSVPHFLFVVDYIEDILHYSSDQANAAWMLYGIGNVVGTPLFGFVADRIGTGITLLLLFILATIAIAVLFLGHALWLADFSYILMGFVAISIVSLVSSYLSELAPISDLTGFWGILTISFAVFQAIASGIMSGWVGLQHGYYRVFAAGSIAMLLSTAVVAVLLLRKALVPPTT